MEGFDELGQLLGALDRSEGTFGVERPGGGPARHHVAIAPSRQRVTFRFVVRAMLIIDLIGFEVTSVFASGPSMPSRLTVNISSRPSRRLFAAPGWAL